MSGDNSHLECRREVARRVASALEKLPEVIGVYVFGSAATGYADEYSDVDIGVVCKHEVPTLSARQEALSSIGTEWRFDDDTWSSPLFEAYDSSGIVDGITVEVHYNTPALVSEVLDTVIAKGALATERFPSRPYRLGALIQRAWVILDREGMFPLWRKQVQNYPLALKQNILRHYLPLLKDCVDELNRTTRRHLGPLMVNFFLFHGMQALYSLIFALNETYDPTDRRAEKTVIPTLSNVPREFVPRLRLVLEGPFDDLNAVECARHFEELAADIISMAEAQLMGDDQQ